MFNQNKPNIYINKHLTENSQRCEYIKQVILYVVLTNLLHKVLWEDKFPLQNIWNSWSLHVHTDIYLWSASSLENWHFLKTQPECNLFWFNIYHYIFLDSKKKRNSQPLCPLIKLHNRINIKYFRLFVLQKCVINTEIVVSSTGITWY